MNFLQSIKNSLSSKTESAIKNNKMIDNADKIDTIEQLVCATHERNGYHRESALKTLMSKYPHHSETLQVLLHRQNDYVEVIRKQALEYLLDWINAENLPILLDNTHHFLHLQEQSRTNQVVLDKLQQLYFNQDNLTSVLDYLHKRQGKAVRAVFQLLQESSIDANKQLTIALASPDIVINMKIWECLQGLPISEQLKILNSSQVKNRQFYFKWLLKIIHNQPFYLWHDSAMNYLKRATPSQVVALMFFLKQEGIDFWQVVDSWMAIFSEEKVSEMTISLIEKNQLTDELKEVVEKHPKWINWHTERLMVDMLLMLPEDEQTWLMIDELKEKGLLSFSQDNKNRIFNHTKIYNLTDFYQYQNLLSLSDKELIQYRHKLPLWEHFLYVMELIDNKKIDKDSEVILTIKQQIKERATIRNKAMKDSQKKTVSQFLQDDNHRQYFIEVESELKWFGLIK